MCSARSLVAFDPFVGTGAVPACFNKHQVPLDWVTNDIDPITTADFHLDAVNAGNWREFPLADCIVSSPPWELLDIVVPLCAQQAAWFSAIHTQGDFISSAPIYRQKWLQKLAAEGRLSTVQGLARPKTRNLRSGIWLIIFRDRHAKQLFWQPPAEVSMYISSTLEKKQHSN